jgi:hypothetical protein
MAIINERFQVPPEALRKRLEVMKQRVHTDEIRSGLLLETVDRETFFGTSIISKRAYRLASGHLSGAEYITMVSRAVVCVDPCVVSLYIVIFGSVSLLDS